MTGLSDGEVAERARLDVEARVHALREADRDRVDRRERRRIPALRLRERPRPRLSQREGSRRREVRSRSFDDRRAASWLAFLVAARVVDRRPEQHGRVDHFIDDPGAERALGRELPRGEDQVERARKTDKPWQPLCPAGRGDEAEACLGEADTNVRGIRGDPRVARERDLQATAERRAVYRRDRDERESREVVEHALHRTARLLDVALRCASSEERQVGAGDVLILLAARDDEAARSRRACRGDRRGEVLHHAYVDRVDRIVGPIDHDLRDARGVRRHEGDGRPAASLDLDELLGRRRRDHAARSRMIAAPLPPAAHAVARP